MLTPPHGAVVARRGASRNDCLILRKSAWTWRESTARFLLLICLANRDEAALTERRTVRVQTRLRSPSESSPLTELIGESGLSRQKSKVVFAAADDLYLRMSSPIVSAFKVRFPTNAAQIRRLGLTFSVQAVGAGCGLVQCAGVWRAVLRASSYRGRPQNSG